MSAQLLGSINKRDKRRSATAICPNKANSCPHLLTCRSSSFTSTMQATDPPFHFYDCASVTWSLATLQRNIKWFLGCDLRKQLRSFVYNCSLLFSLTKHTNYPSLQWLLWLKSSLLNYPVWNSQSLILPPIGCSKVIIGWTYGSFHRTWFLIIAELGDV